MEEINVLTFHLFFFIFNGQLTNRIRKNNKVVQRNWL